MDFTPSFSLVCPKNWVALMIYNTFPYSTGHKNWREIPYSGTHPNICWQYAPINIHIPWISHEYLMNIPWISHEYPMNIPWIFHGYPHRYCLSRLRITGLSQFSGHAERRHHVPGRKCHRMEGSPADLGRCSAGARGGPVTGWPGKHFWVVGIYPAW